MCQRHQKFITEMAANAILPLRGIASHGWHL